MDNAILTTTNLSVGYRTRKAVKTILEGINLSLHTGRLTCLFGANGTGKSTLLRTLCAVQPPLHGEITLRGVEHIGQLSRQELSKLISIVNTDSTSAGALTVQEVVSLGRYPYTDFFGNLDDNDRTIVAQALADVRMSGYENRLLATLSDGERQKTMIARALAQNTPIIILDEPTSFLDAASRIEILALLKSLTHKDKAVLVSTHDISQSLAMADDLWLLTTTGQIISGDAASILATPSQLNLLFTNRAVTFDPVRGDFVAE